MTPLTLSTAALVAITCAAVTIAEAAADAAWEDCTAESPDRSIAGCTKVMQRVRDAPTRRALASFNRAAAYAAKGEFKRAMNDFGAAMNLDTSERLYIRCTAAAVLVVDSQNSGQPPEPLPDVCLAKRLR